MQKPKLEDPVLAALLSAEEDGRDRPFYELGVMLDAKDFTAEQTYHRNRLARALATIHGPGTVAGLEVGSVAGRAAGPTVTGRPNELRVSPGLAIDHFGRLLEVRRPLCIDLDRWWGDGVVNDGTDEDNRARFQGQAAAYQAALNGFIADVFVRFVACGREPTPAFAHGAADALDATVLGRVRDQVEVRLEPRIEVGPLLPVDPWADLAGADRAARVRAMRERQLTPAYWLSMFNPPPPREVPATLAAIAAPGLSDDGNRAAQWLFLARTRFATAAPIGANAPRPTAVLPSSIDNLSRRFVPIAGAIAHLEP